MIQQFFNIAVNIPLRRLFTYSSSETAPINIGQRVVLRFNNKRSQAIVIEQLTEEQSQNIDFKVLEIEAQPDRFAVLSQPIIKLCHWISQYYQQPLGEVIQLALPKIKHIDEDITGPIHKDYWEITPLGKDALAFNNSSLSKAPKQREALTLINQKPLSKQSKPIASSILKALTDKSFIALKQQKLEHIKPRILSSDIQVNKEQESAINHISFDAFNCTLLNGVTGSGKTEVYIRLTERALENNKQVLILVPEIALVQQMQSRFQQRFEARIASTHSGLSDKKRFEQWQIIYNQLSDIIIGTRSALFSPAKNIGLIIIDEEHDSSYQQSDGVRFNARNAAIYYAKSLNIPIILGSATPSLESLHNAEQGNYQLAELRQKAMTTEDSSITLLDSSKEKLFHGLAASSILQAKQVLKQGHQVLFFINRRGYAPLLHCQSCGYQCECHHCDAKLTYHRKSNLLICHHCGAKQQPPSTCPKCDAQDFAYIGQGTEQIEEALQKALPDWPIYRIDRDVIAKPAQLKQTLAQVHSNEPCILLGTEMVTKGHHFEKLSLVIVINADGALYSTDFRATEFLAQQLMQVSGRAGRTEAGQVIIQTALKEHPLFHAITEQNYLQYAQELLQTRQQSQLPPFVYFAVIRAEDKQEQKAQLFCQELLKSLSQYDSDNHRLGPAPALMKRKNQLYRYQVLFIAKDRKALHKELAIAVQIAESLAGKTQRWHIEVDPQAIL